MWIRRSLLACAGASLLFVLAGCPQPLPGDLDPSIEVLTTGQGGVNGLTAYGLGWKPGSKLSVKMWHEPNGPGSVLSEWKHMFDVTVDSTGMFGVVGASPFYAVRRSICGGSPAGQTLLVMAKSLDTGRVRMRQVPVDIYFTFQPC